MELGRVRLNWIWGLGNDTYIALLCLVPFVNLVMIFVLGARGSEWAWQNRRWNSIAHFQRVQRGWAIAALTLLGLGIAGTVAMLVLFSTLFSGIGEIQGMAMQRLRANPEAVAILGEPIEEAGRRSFNMHLNGPHGTATLELAVSGTAASGILQVQAESDAGEWYLVELVLTVTAQQIDLLASP